MQESGSLLALLATVTAISLTGVIAPGPVTAVTITKGVQRKWAGPLVALGHAIVELPMFLLVWLGFATFLAAPWVRVVVGVAGGLVLIWMGIGMLRTKQQAFEQQRDVGRGCVLAGMTTSIANPYWLLWWATVGPALVVRASAWGLLGVLAFAAAHLLCDLGWLSFLSWGVFTSRRFFKAGVFRAVLAACGVALLGFGVYFIVSGARFLSL